MRGQNSLLSIIITKQTKLSLRWQLHRTSGTFLSPFKRGHHHSPVVFAEAGKGKPIPPPDIYDMHSPFKLPNMEDNEEGQVDAIEKAFDMDYDVAQPF